MKETIAIITVNWNGKKDTLRLLRSLTEMRDTGKHVFLYVVDNASSDGSVTSIEKEFPTVRVIRQNTNTGFAAANNTGIGAALSDGADYVWLLNNDTFVDRNALQLVRAFDRSRTGAACSKIYFAAGKEYHHDRYTVKDRGRVIWYAGGVIDWNNVYLSHRGVNEVDSGQYNLPQDTEFATGCSVLLSRECINAVGFFDEKFFMYLEDADYSMRIRSLGMHIRYQPQSVVWHTNAASGGGPGSPLHEYYLTRNRLLFGFRYAPLRTRLALVREAMRFMAGGNAIRRRAVADALLGRWGNQYEKR